MRTYSTPRMETVSTRLPTATIEQIEAMAEADQRPRASMLRVLIERALSEQRRP